MHACPRVGCGAVFPRPYRLAAHLLLHDNKKEFKCSHTGCGREYTSNSHLLRHYASAHEPEETSVFSCPHCIKIYSNRQNLNRHIKIAHTIGKPYKCDECQRGFTKKHQLTAHMYQHTGVKGFCCEYCPKTFATLYDKKRHMRFHKTYSCKECNGIFQLWSKLQEHRKMEHSEKEYICHHCNRGFKARSHIVHHMKRHSIDRIFFVCEIVKCERFYTTKFNLKQHMELVHSGKTFDCTLCDAKLATKAKLERHTDTHNDNIKSTTQARENKKMRKERKDKGIPKKPVVAKLAGIELSGGCQDSAQVDSNTSLFILG